MAKTVIFIIGGFFI